MLLTVDDCERMAARPVLLREGRQVVGVDLGSGRAWSAAVACWLLAASLSVALVKNDDQGNMRLSKNGSNNTARDDVAAGLVLVAGAYARAMEKPRPRWQYRRMVG